MYICPMHNKELLKGTLTAIVLKLLADNGEMYGYELAQKVKEMSGQKILLKDGSLYPSLHKLTKEGWLQYREEHIGKRVRKYYFLTKSGKAQEQIESEKLKDFIRTLKDLLFPDFTFKIA